MAMPANVTKLKKCGSALHVLIPKQVIDLLCWRPDEVLAYRLAGDKIILQRIPTENYAKIGMAPAEGGVR